MEESTPLPSSMPIILVGILFGLAMDYQVFLVSRIHEAHVRGLSPSAAIRDGFNRSVMVVAAAATIMASVFLGFGYSGAVFVTIVATGLAVGVLIDAFIVRMIVFPATLALSGNVAWWIPSWLDRMLPRIDAEGCTLTPVPARGPLAGAATPAESAPLAN